MVTELFLEGAGEFSVALSDVFVFLFIAVSPFFPIGIGFCWTGCCSVAVGIGATSFLVGKIT